MYFIIKTDTETLSERDFICPAKRRRQDNDGSVDTNFVLRRPASDGDRYRVLDTNSLLEVPDFLPKRKELRYVRIYHILIETKIKHILV